MKDNCRILILILGGAISSCAPFGNDADLARRINEQDMQLRQMQPQQADTLNEVKAMREEIRQLKGQLAAMQGESQQSAAPGGEAAGAAAAEQGQGIVLQPGNAPDSSAYSSSAPSAPGAETQMRQPIMPDQQAGNYGLPQDQPIVAQAPGEATWGQADPQPAAPEPPAEPEAKKDLALALFEAGENDFKARKYAAAERSFQDFIKNYPKHAKIAQAQYNLGECYFAANNFPQAALAYDEIIRKYPKSQVLAGAYLKEGIAFSKMGNREAARLRLNELIKKFPNSAEAKRAQAFLKTNK